MHGKCGARAPDLEPQRGGSKRGGGTHCRPFFVRRPCPTPRCRRRRPRRFGTLRRRPPAPHAPGVTGSEPHAKRACPTGGGRGARGACASAIAGLKPCVSPTPRHEGGRGSGGRGWGVHAVLMASVGQARGRERGGRGGARVHGKCGARAPDLEPQRRPQARRGARTAAHARHGARVPRRDVAVEGRGVLKHCAAAPRATRAGCHGSGPHAGKHTPHTSESGMRAWKGGPPDRIVYRSTANRPPRGTPIGMARRMPDGPAHGLPPACGTPASRCPRACLARRAALLLCATRPGRRSRG